MSSRDGSVVNHWPDAACAEAFWGQQELPPYRQLLRHTVEWLDLEAGQRWLDLGCGGGRLTRALWEKSGGTLDEVVALDCADANATAIDKLRRTMKPAPTEEQVHFLHTDFSGGLSALEESSYNGVVSGLAVQYAEHWSEERKAWTSEAYEQLLVDVHRVLTDGGTFVFSVNPPNPSWGKVALTAVPGFFVSGNPFKYLLNAWRMWKYGRWLKSQARAGRFQYLPWEEVEAKLKAAGFVDIEHRMSFSKQAYLVRCRKPGSVPMPERAAA